MADSSEKSDKDVPPSLFSILLTLIIIVVVAALAFKLFWPKPLIPKGIQKQTTYTIFLPSLSSVVPKRETVKYDPKLKLLSYRAEIFGVNAVISEQPTPESFTDIPQVYDKVLDSWKDYDSFDSTQGKVYLTRPGDQGGKQAAVMNAKGTLMFVKPDKDLSGEQWRQFFTSLNIVK